MFEQLLKYPVDIFRQGDFYFGIRLPGAHSIPHLCRFDCSVNLGRIERHRGGHIEDFAAFSSSSEPSRSADWHSVCSSPL